MVLTAQICFPSFLSPLCLAPFPAILDSSSWFLDQLVQGFFLTPLVKKIFFFIYLLWKPFLRGAGVWLVLQCRNWRGGAGAPHQQLERETCNAELKLIFRSGNFPGQVPLENFGSSGWACCEKEVREDLLGLCLWNELPDTCFGREPWDQGICCSGSARECRNGYGETLVRNDPQKISKKNSKKFQSLIKTL